jgi:hypothetical protein
LLQSVIFRFFAKKAHRLNQNLTNCLQMVKVQ